MAGPPDAGLGFERDAGGADVMGVEPADLVVLDLADIGRARAEIGDADDGVGGRAAGHFGRRAHVAVDRRRRAPRRSAPCRPWSCRGGRESPRRSAPARRKSHCRSRERRILRQPSILSCLRQFRERLRPITISPAPASDGCYRSRHDPLLPHGIHGNAGLAAARIRARFHDRGAARRGPGRRCVPGGVSTGQCGQAAVDRRRAERGAGAGLAARARDRRRGGRGGLRRPRARHRQRGADRGRGADRPC